MGKNVIPSPHSHQTSITHSLRTKFFEMRLIVCALISLLVSLALLLEAAEDFANKANAGSLLVIFLFVVQKAAKMLAFWAF